jgi:hypothetical protein
VTVGLGLLAAVAVHFTGPAASRSFASVSGAVQILMSVAVPLFGILLVGDVRRGPRPARLTPALLGSGLLAGGVGVVGIIISAVTLLVAPETAPDPWARAGTIAVGSVLVQVVAVLVGTGLGLLIRPAVLAFVATIVVPMSVWLGLSAVPSAQEWLTPYATAQHLLSGEMTALTWTQWCVIALLWSVGLNALGAARLRRY